MPAAAAAAAQGHPSGPERPAEEAPSAAGSDPAPSTSSAGPRPPKRKAIKNDKDEPLDKSAPSGTTGQKRRRRVFSCQSCQRLKCRCEYDPGSQACHRCVTLRSVFIHLPTYSVIKFLHSSVTLPGKTILNSQSTGLNARSRGRFSMCPHTQRLWRMRRALKNGKWACNYTCVPIQSHDMSILST